MPPSEEEQRRCCILGGCGCLSAKSRGKALAEQLAAWGTYDDAARHLLQDYILIPRAMLERPEEPGGAA